MLAIRSVPLAPLLASAGLAQGQLTPTWTTHFTNPGAPPSSLLEMDMGPAGAIYVAGLSAPSAPAGFQPLDVDLARFGDQGALQWSVVFGGPGKEGIAGVAADPNGGVYLCGLTTEGINGVSVQNGADPYLARYDASGNQEWVRQEQTFSYGEYTAILAHPTSGLYLACNNSGQGSSEPNSWLARHDAAGNELWRREGLVRGASSLAPDGEGGLFAVGLRPTTGAYVRRFNEAGQSQWFEVLSNPFQVFRIECASDGAGGLLVAWDQSAPSNLWNRNLARYDADGNQLWHVAHPLEGTVSLVSELLGDGAGNWWSMDRENGPTSSAADDDHVLTQFGDDGKVLWSSDFVTPDLEGSRARFRTNGDGALFVWDFVFTPVSGIPAGYRLRRYDVLPGQVYCAPAVANSTGSHAQIRFTGTSSLSEELAGLVVSGLPVGESVLFLSGQVQGFTALAGGSQGNLCLAGAIGRYVAPGQVQPSGTAGTATLPLDLASNPQPSGVVPALVGQTWNWQAWYRDGQGSNFTDAVSVTMQ